MMSGDEEVVNKGNELYKHLLSLGYSEFETFDCKEKLSEQEDNTSCLKSSESKTQYLNEIPPILSNQINLSVEAHQIISTIIASKLLFIEDIELLESLVSNSSIYNYNQFMNIRSIAGSLSLCLASWALYYQVGTFCQLPLYLTGFCSLLCFWHCQKVYVEKNDRNFLNSHIESLKDLCICIQKTYRFIKETEILATGKVSTQNVNSAMYIKTTMNGKDTKELSAWKLLPHLRKKLVVVLYKTIKILLLSCSSLSEYVPFWLEIKPRFKENHCDLEELETLCESNYIDSDNQISIGNLQSFIELYLDIQSEYLKILACCLFPQKLCKSYPMGRLHRFKFMENSIRVRDLLKILCSVQSMIVQVCVQLKVEQDMHNKFSRFSENNPDSFPKAEYSNRINHLQGQLHNIFLLLELMLLRIRSLEDVVEDIHDKGDNKINEFPFEGSLVKELGSVRTDFQIAMKEFDDIYNHLIPLKPTATSLTLKKIDWENQSCTKSKLISTGILLGTSDFSVNDSDEFFLTTAGSNTECEERSIDDFELESVSKMPKSLISELSMTLKSIRKEFRARERLALERIGLDGVENLPSDDEDGNNEVSLRKKEMCVPSNNKDCTDSAISMSIDTFEENDIDKRLCLDVDEDVCSGDDQRDVSDLNKILLPTFPNSSSIANLVAMKSKMWGNQSEECFADE